MELWRNQAVLEKTSTRDSWLRAATGTQTEASRNASGTSRCMCGPGLRGDDQRTAACQSAPPPPRGTEEASEISVTLRVCQLHCHPLHAEDNAVNALLASVLLMKAGHHVTHVVTGRKALDAIVVFTAHAMAEDRKRFLDAGADGYLSKPFSPEQLHAVIESLRSIIDAQIARVDLPASAA